MGAQQGKFILPIWLSPEALLSKEQKAYLKALGFSPYLWLKNRFLYGKNAPKYKELAWVNPDSIKYNLTQCVRQKMFGTLNIVSGTVISGTWDEHVVPVNLKTKRDHWIGGFSWKELGVYDYKMGRVKLKGESDGCKNYEDVVARYERLDKLFETVKSEGRLRTQEELTGKKRTFARGRGEIEIFIDRNGSPIHGCGGTHRLAIAKILNLPVIPATWGGVHPEGIKHLHKYRNKPNSEQKIT